MSMDFVMSGTFGVSAGKRDQIDKKFFFEIINVLDQMIKSKSILLKNFFLKKISIWSLFPALTPYIQERKKSKYIQERKKKANIYKKEKSKKQNIYKKEKSKKQNILQRKKKQIYYDTENKLRKYANTNKKNKKIVVKSKN